MTQLQTIFNLIVVFACAFAIYWLFFTSPTPTKPEKSMIPLTFQEKPVSVNPNPIHTGGGSPALIDDSDDLNPDTDNPKPDTDNPNPIHTGRGSPALNISDELFESLVSFSYSFLLQFFFYPLLIDKG
jgi:hypothetical protein